MFKVSKIKFENNLKDTIVKSVDLIGGFKHFIKTGDVVFFEAEF